MIKNTLFTIIRSYPLWRVQAFQWAFPGCKIPWPGLAQHTEALVQPGPAHLIRALAVSKHSMKKQYRFEEHDIG